MANNFPANPVVGQTFATDTYTYAFDGVKWTSVKRSVTNVFDNLEQMRNQTDLKIGDWCKVLEPLSEYIIGEAGEFDLENGLNARMVNRENAAVLKNFGYTFKGYFGTAFTLTGVNDVGISEDDRIYKYIGDPINFPVSVSPGANPAFSTNLYEEIDLTPTVDHSDTINRDAVDAHDTIYARQLQNIQSLREHPIEGYEDRTFETREYTVGSGIGGSRWRSVLTSTVTPNNQDVIQSTYNPSISYVQVKGSSGYVITGNNSPVGSVSANPGTIYLNLLGGAGATIWIKESGSGTTGWRAL